ncbi:MAG: hypothetical protein WCE75_16695 [Terracidiphilus sp.]
MELACSRCHATLRAEDCYCPACGLPQLVFAAEGGSEQPITEPWNQAARDASSVAWKPALRAALALAVPAGLLSSQLSVLGGFAIFWMAAAAACAVVLYIRGQRPAWITTGAGARIGLVTGLLAGWFTFAFSSATLFVQRNFLHQGARIDGEWQWRVAQGQQLAEQFTSGMAGADQAAARAAQAQFQAWMLSPEGHAGMEVFRFGVDTTFLLLFAVLGGALGARMLAQSRRPEI